MMNKEGEIAFLVNVELELREYHDDLSEKKEVQHIVYAEDVADAKTKVENYFNNKLRNNEYYSELNITVSETIF